MMQNPALCGVFCESAERANGARLEVQKESLVKMVRGDIHEWRKQSAISGGAGSLVKFADVNEGLDKYWHIVRTFASVSC